MDRQIVGRNAAIKLRPRQRVSTAENGNASASICRWC
jgi:hypothetical protein